MIDSNLLKPEEYLKKAYLNKERWVSYAIQIMLVKKMITQGKILEIGVGNSLVADFLRKIYYLQTVDINPDLKPDFIASVDDLDSLADNQFDLVSCFEVLEHLNFERFVKSLKELNRVSSRYVLLSLPYWGYTFGFKMKLPIFGEHVLKFKISGFKKHQFNGQHYWEIGKRGYTLKLIKDLIKAEGLKICESFWDLDDPYHYYFVLEK
ncbi:MAG: class I SAM-dependent methyltransferase [Candidatus Buchananbacteria bacterium]